MEGQSVIRMLVMTGWLSFSTVPLLSVTGVLSQMESTTYMPEVTRPNAAY